MKIKERNIVHPSLWDYYYLEGLGRANHLKNIFGMIFQEGSNRWNEAYPALLLDLGGRDSPYKELARGYPVRWISADLRRHGPTEILLDAQRLPFKDAEVDLILCTQVLGCIPELSLVMTEMHRVLKPGGRVILTEAAVFPPWGDEARWRILPEGWQTLLKNFSECKVQADLTTAASFIRVMNLYLTILLQRVFVLEKIWQILLCPLFNLLGRWMNRRCRDHGFSSNYLAVGRK